MKHYQTISQSTTGRALWDKLFIQQEGRCALCGVGDKELLIDHDHKSGQVRGLLCRSCNGWMGHHLDKEHDHDFLRKALEYLYNPPGKRLDNYLPTVKYCSFGDHTLPASEFYQYKRHGKVRLSGYCKGCTREYQKQRKLKGASGESQDV